MQISNFASIIASAYKKTTQKTVTPKDIDAQHIQISKA